MNKERLRTPAVITAATALVLGMAGCMGAGERSSPSSPPAAVSSPDVASATTSVPLLESLPEPEIHEGVASSSAGELRKLGEYQEQYKRPIANEMMLFTDTPATTAEAEALAANMAKRLKEFNEHGVRPLVVLEPAFNGIAFDFTKYKDGEYDTATAAYYQALRDEGITDVMMGTWAVFPEANTPAWGEEGKPSTFRTDPATVAGCIAKAATLQKQVFPKSKVTVLLDSTTYKSGDVNWETGKHTSLAPYVKGVPAGLLDSVGLQGFPWVGPGESGKITGLDPANYLDAKLVIGLAKAAGVRSVWFNTGTFARMHTGNPNETVAATVAQRQRLLANVVTQVRYARAQGYDVGINLFVEDKSKVLEAVDWSYGANGHQQLLINFLQQLRDANVSASLFDTAE